MKKLVSIILCILMLIAFIPAHAYSVEDAYNEIQQQYPQFIEDLQEKNVGKEITISFLTDVRDYMREINKSVEITEENFEKYAMDAVTRISSREEYVGLQDALIELYPDAILQAIKSGIIADEFKPLITTVKKLVFDNNMLNEDIYVIRAKSLFEDVLVGSNYTLPEKLIMITENGEEISADVSWRGSVNVSKTGSFTVQGIITLPQGYFFSAGMSNAVDYTVNVVEKLEQKSRFNDITADFWGYTAICALADNFILNGYLDGSFKPENNITRAEFAKIIVSATGKYDYEAAASFTDVSGDDWYYVYVASAYKNGYITGYPDGSFKPDDFITRADICTVVHRAVKDKLQSKTEISQFSDDYDMPSYARDAVYSLAKNGIIGGMGDGSFKPRNYATRAQTAKIIYSAFFTL